MLLTPFVYKFGVSSGSIKSGVVRPITLRMFASPHLRDFVTRISSQLVRANQTKCHAKNEDWIGLRWWSIRGKRDNTNTWVHTFNKNLRRRNLLRGKSDVFNNSVPPKLGIWYERMTGAIPPQLRLRAPSIRQTDGSSVHNLVLYKILSRASRCPGGGADCRVLTLLLYSVVIHWPVVSPL